MANIKKATLKEILERLEEVEKWKNEIENYGSKWDTNPPGVILSSRATNEMRKLEALEKKVEELEKLSVPTQEPVVFPVNADGKTVLTNKTLFPAVPVNVVTTEKHECQVNTCKNVETKAYERPSGRMWLCEVHKF